MNSQYAGAFAPEDDDDEPDEAPKAKKPKKGANSKVKKLKSKPAETEDLDPDLIEAYVPNLYGEKRLTYIATHAPQYGNKEACRMWNSSLQKARLLAGVSLKELKKRKFVDKNCSTNPYKEVVLKQAKLGGA